MGQAQLSWTESLQGGSRSKARVAKLRGHLYHSLLPEDDLTLLADKPESPKPPLLIIL